MVSYLGLIKYKQAMNFLYCLNIEKYQILQVLQLSMYFWRETKQEGNYFKNSTYRVQFILKFFLLFNLQDFLSVTKWNIYVKFKRILQFLKGLQKFFLWLFLLLKLNLLDFWMLWGSNYQISYQFKIFS